MKYSPEWFTFLASLPFLWDGPQIATYHEKFNFLSEAVKWGLDKEVSLDG